MNVETMHMEQEVVRKILSTQSPDAALLYLYIYSGNDFAGAEKDLKLPQTRLATAAATLRHMGLWPEERKTIVMSGERPNYSEGDVLMAMDTDSSFRSLYGEVQRVLGRALNTEELKILLGFVRYLGLPAEVISVLVSYCKERARQKGGLRNPSLRTIEKEAYAWAEQGIETLEDAAAFIQNQNMRNTRIGRVMRQMQIYGRKLTSAEEKYAGSWIEMGFDDEAILEAYERTCLNTGGLNWKYMNKILMRWHEAGLHTGEKIRSGDKKPENTSGQRQLDAEERAAIARMLREE